jgi:hypothetical protein
MYRGETAPINPQNPTPNNVQNDIMPGAPVPEPLFLIVADYDRGFFWVEGPMAEDSAWKDAALNARNHERSIGCGPTGPDRDGLATDYHRPQARRRSARQHPRPRR